MERAVYRIIDANFNRAREAVRVVEEFCRFALNSASLTKRAKRLRHQLSVAMGKLDSGLLMSSRDTLGDVGAGSVLDEQFKRGDLKDCLTAGCKRLTEALRALAEMASAVDGLDRSVAETLERLRFDAYALEKDIVLFGDPIEKFRRVGLYVIISSNLPADVISLTHRCLAGGADCIQLRAKDIKDDRLFAVAVEFVHICIAGGALSVINDRVDVATAAGADGVHLGQNDLAVEQARKLALTPLIVGKSTHSAKELRKSCDEQPTYVSLGPVFATPTKPKMEPVGLGYVKHGIETLAGSGIGHVAIGGITVDNVEDVLKAGATSIAVCSAVTEAKDSAAACRALKDKIAAFSTENGL
jgi:thiamine-phosphate pyrophosphorylase